MFHVCDLKKTMRGVLLSVIGLIFFKTLLVSLGWYCHGDGSDGGGDEDDDDDKEQLFALIMHCEDSCELNPTSDVTSVLSAESDIFCI